MKKILPHLFLLTLAYINAGIAVEDPQRIKAELDDGRRNGVSFASESHYDSPKGIFDK